MNARIVELKLTPDQIEAVAPIVRRATIDRHNVLFVSSFAPDIQDGQSIWRWQIASVSFKTAQRILKIIKSDMEAPNV